MEIRTAIIRRSSTGYPTPEQVKAYLPSNYSVLTTYRSPLGSECIVITGCDNAG
jgi:hypothetical protein